MAGGSPTPRTGKGCRWGVMSVGKIANDFATALNLVGDDDGEGRHAVVACASSSSTRAAAFGAKHGVSPARCYDDYAALAEDPDVDVVYVASIHTQHKAQVMLLLESGKHVLCEKPMAVCARDVREMVARPHTPNQPRLYSSPPLNSGLAKLNKKGKK
jgi:predicted dehydrogenase